MQRDDFAQKQEINPQMLVEHRNCGCSSGGYTGRAIVGSENIAMSRGVINGSEEMQVISFGVHQHPFDLLGRAVPPINMQYHGGLLWIRKSFITCISQSDRFTR